MFWLRHGYYRLVNRLSSVETFENFTGFGLYDRKVIDQVMAFGDPYPYFRGMIADIGMSYKKIHYDQPVRIRGITKNNFYTLYELAMLGIVNHSKVPLRLATFTGFVGAALSFFLGLAYLIYKLLYLERSSRPVRRRSSSDFRSPRPCSSCFLGSSASTSARSTPSCSAGPMRSSGNG